MHNPEYTDNPDIYFDEAPTETGASLAAASDFPPIAAGNMSRHTKRGIESRMQMEAARMRGHGALSGELIMNTIALSAIGEQAARTAPGAQAAIQHIVNVYAASSAQGLAERWSLWRR